MLLLLAFAYENVGYLMAKEVSLQDHLISNTNMIDAQSCVQLKLGLILWCFNACTVVHVAGSGSTKQQWTVLVVTAMYSIFIESLLYYSSLTDTSNKTAWLCVTKLCHLLGSRLCYSLPTAHFWQHCALSKAKVAVSGTVTLHNVCC